MKYATHGNGKGLNDLYIAFDNAFQAQKVRDYLMENNRPYHYFVGKKGSDMAGMSCFDIPMGEALEADIKALFVDE